MAVKVVRNRQDCDPAAPAVRVYPAYSYEKYKTEMCRNWQRGNCEFGERCTFAHGAIELRQKRLQEEGRVGNRVVRREEGTKRRESIEVEEKRVEEKVREELGGRRERLPVFKSFAP